MQSPQKDTDFYLRFEEQLQASQEWPGIYLFKFIVKAGAAQKALLKSFFNDFNPDFSEKNSSKNTFTSLSVKVKMSSPKEVIAIYKRTENLEGVMAL